MEIENTKRYDLEERTLRFGKDVIVFCKTLPSNAINRRLSDQLIRSGTSVGANYREANETETKKDFIFRIRICRKEAKETAYWLQLLSEANAGFAVKIEPLLKETQELIRILATILKNYAKNNP